MVYMKLLVALILTRVLCDNYDPENTVSENTLKAHYAQVKKM